jgi:hypothetical protein
MPRSISINSITCDPDTGEYTVSGDCSDPTQVSAELRATGIATPLFPVIQDGGTKWHVVFSKAGLDPNLQYQVVAALNDGQQPPLSDTQPVPPCNEC